MSDRVCGRGGMGNTITNGYTRFVATGAFVISYGQCTEPGAQQPIEPITREGGVEGRLIENIFLFHTPSLRSCVCVCLCMWMCAKHKQAILAMPGIRPSLEHMH